MSRYNYRQMYSWDCRIAYLAGLMASDGCLINDGRHLAIVSKDIEIINNVQQILGTNLGVAIKTGGFGSQAFHFQFSNVSLYDFLLKAGITPTKSKTIGAINVPDTMYADFLRGYFDGDGTVYGYQDKRWVQSFMYYTGFVSASRTLLLWLQLKNIQLAGTTPGVIKPQARAATLTYAKCDSRKLFAFMYKDKDCLKLTRKYDKFVDFLTSDPYNTDDARVL